MSATRTTQILLMRDLLILAAAIGLFFFFLLQIPVAMEQEAQFRENIRQARCDRNYMKGYCDGLPEKDWLTQVAAQ